MEDQLRAKLISGCSIKIHSEKEIERIYSNSWINSPKENVLAVAGRTFELNEDQIYQLRINENCIIAPGDDDPYFRVRVYTIFIAEVINSIKEEETEAVVETDPLKLTAEEKQIIIEEMLEKVEDDKETFYTLIGIGAHGVNISTSKMNALLREWANQKWKMYLLFGRQLVVNQPIKTEMDSGVIEAIKADLNKINPIASSFFGTLSLDEVRKNIIEYTSPYVKSNAVGNKLSGFIADNFSKETIDWFANNVFTKRDFTHNISYSIHPIDYLTMSVNRSNWQSCHEIGEGCYSNGILDLMLDSTTIVVFKSASSTVKYEYNGYEWGDKNWRELFYLDIEHLTFIASRQYPNYNEELAKEVRFYLEELFEQFFHLSGSTWKIKRNYHEGYYEDGKNYHDVTEGYPHYYLYYGKLDRKAKFHVGDSSYMSCLACGNELSSGSNFTCGYCNGDEDYNEDSEEENDNY